MAKISARRVALLRRPPSCTRLTRARDPPMAFSPTATATAALSDFEVPFPPLVRAATAPATSPVSRTAVDPSLLAPDEPFNPASPPRRRPAYGSGHGSGSERPRRKGPSDSHSRSRDGRRKRTWKKLLWVKQSCASQPLSRPLPSSPSHPLPSAFPECSRPLPPPDLTILTVRCPPDPDNYTDQATFLENLQRNPRLQPYDFWPLVADSTVIVQHVCSVVIFVVCFVGIFQERVSPVAVVGWGSFATFVGWLLWDWWVGQESADDEADVLARTRSFGRGRPFRPPSPPA